MKTFIKFYALLSLLQSLAFSATGDYGIAEGRCPFLLIQVISSRVEFVGSGYATGTDMHGDFIAYAPDGLQPGDTVWHIMVYNPLTSYADDIIARYDF